MRFSAPGVAVYVHREVLEGLAARDRLGFAFGRFGRCWLRLGGTSARRARARRPGDAR